MIGVETMSRRQVFAPPARVAGLLKYNFTILHSYNLHIFQWPIASLNPTVYAFLPASRCAADLQGLDAVTVPGAGAQDTAAEPVMAFTVPASLYKHPGEAAGPSLCPLHPLD